MSHVQSMLTIFGMTLLALSSLRFNSSVADITTSEVENKVYLTAFSLADDLIEEIKTKSFDEATIKFPTTNPAHLTAAASLNKESGEVYPNFDDIDDFNNYSRIIDAPHAEKYLVDCKVQYVNGNSPDNISSVPTFYKKVTTTVSSPFLRYPVKLSFIFTLK